MDRFRHSRWLTHQLVIGSGVTAPIMIQPSLRALEVDESSLACCTPAPRENTNFLFKARSAECRICRLSALAGLSQPFWASGMAVRCLVFFIEHVGEICSLVRCDIYDVALQFRA
jgi:hypothetical protein